MRATRPGTAAAVRRSHSLREQGLPRVHFQASQFRGGVLGDRGQVEFHRILLDFHFDGTGFGMLGSPQPGLAIAADDADARVVGSAVSVEEQVGDGALAVRRDGEVRADGAAIPETQQFVAMADEQRRIVGQDVGIVRDRLWRWRRGPCRECGWYSVDARLWRACREERPTSGR